MTLSSVFMMWEVKETGLKFAAVPLDPPLWTGTTKANLSNSGSFPSSRNFLNKGCRGSPNLNLHFLRRMAGTPSGPVAAPVESLSIFSMISSLVKITLSRPDLDFQGY